jgi:hypothetical protein
VRSASFTGRMAYFRPLRLPVLETELALRADALWLRLARATDQLDVADGSVVTEMSGNREIIDGANGRVFHF